MGFARHSRSINEGKGLRRRRRLCTLGMTAGAEDADADTGSVPASVWNNEAADGGVLAFAVYGGKFRSELVETCAGRWGGLGEDTAV